VYTPSVRILAIHDASKKRIERASLSTPSLKLRSDASKKRIESFLFALFSSPLILLDASKKRIESLVHLHSPGLILAMHLKRELKVLYFTCVPFLDVSQMHLKRELKADFLLDNLDRDIV